MGCCIKINVDEVMATTNEAQYSISEFHASSSKFMCSSSAGMSTSWQPHLSGIVIPEDLGANAQSKSKFQQPHHSGTVLSGDLGIPKYNSDFWKSTASTAPWSTQHSMTGPPPTHCSESWTKTSITEVTSQLYLGSYEDAKNVEELRSRAITHTLTLIGKKHVIAGIKHMQKPMHDWGKTDLQILINNIWTFVVESQRPGNKLFVHCMLGQNRSATIMIVILMKLHGESLEEAFKIIKKKRPIVQINTEYAKQLSKMEQELHGRKSVTNNWMEIRRANMATGSVAFFGDSMMNVQTVSSTNC